MSETPDLSTLPKRMLWAATVIEEFNSRYNVTVDMAVCASTLRREADVVAVEDHKAAEREELVWQLARELLAAFAIGPSAGEIERKSTRIAAELLIQNGWTKEDPA